ncbi:hypothetical protein ACFQ0M_48940 [Kitasatospora aburaviensis]
MLQKTIEVFSEKVDEPPRHAAEPASEAEAATRQQQDAAYKEWCERLEAQELQLEAGRQQLAAADAEAEPPPAAVPPSTPAPESADAAVGTPEGPAAEAAPAAPPPPVALPDEPAAAPEADTARPDTPAGAEAERPQVEPDRADSVALPVEPAAPSVPTPQPEVVPEKSGGPAAPAEPVGGPAVVVAEPDAEVPDRARKLAQAAWRTRVRRFAEERREAPERAREFGHWYIAQGWESPKYAPLAELFDQWLEANPRPVTELERALGLQGTEMYLGYSGRFDGDYDIQAADGGLYVMRQPSLVHNRTRFSVRYVPDPDWPTNTDAVATVDTVEEVMAAVRRHVEKRAVLAPPAAEQEELFAVPAAALPSPPAAAPPTPAARVASDRPIGVTRIEVDGHQALIRLGRGGVREDRHGQYWVSCDCPAEGSARIVHRNAQEDDTSWCRTRATPTSC